MKAKAWAIYFKGTKKELWHDGVRIQKKESAGFCFWNSKGDQGEFYETKKEAQEALKESFTWLKKNEFKKKENFIIVKVGIVK